MTDMAREYVGGYGFDGEPELTGEEIVRCSDCYFADEIEGGYWCDRFDCGKEHVTSNGFCAWAVKRKENDE